jgi:hypothetical protein
MLSTANTPLVVGGVASPMTTRWVKVVRSFFHQGKPIPVGEVVELPRWVAAEALFCGKAVKAEKPVIAEVSVEPEVAPAPQPTRGNRNARK